MLAQAIGNLIDNALKYAGEDRSIRVEVASPPDGPVQISVADDGPGIPDDEKPKVSGRFYRGDTSRGTPGVGLGLSLVQSVAKVHGGALELQDNHPGLRARMIIPRGALVGSARADTQQTVGAEQGMGANRPVRSLRRSRLAERLKSGAELFGFFEMNVRKLVTAVCAVLAGLLTIALAAAEEASGARPPQQVVARIKPCGYPAGAHGDEVGTAVVHVWLDDKGHPTKTYISSSSGFPALDAAAQECARQSVWEPVQRQGKPAPYETDARFEWKGNTLPQTCDRPLRRNSLYTVKIRLTPAAASQVKFEHQKPKRRFPLGSSVKP